MIRRLYLRKHHQSPSSLFLPSVALVLGLDLDNDFLRVLRLVLPSGDCEAFRSVSVRFFDDSTVT
jgi:hypothetical protein